MFLLSAQSNFYIILSSYVEKNMQKKIKSEFHVFGWFPGFQNLDAFLNNIVWSYFENWQK